VEMALGKVMLTWIHTRGGGWGKRDLSTEITGMVKSALKLLKQSMRG